MPIRKAGLRVQYHNHVEKLTTGKAEVIAAVPAGWFIEVLRSAKWIAIMDLRFMREKDAIRAAYSLTVAGLDTYQRIKAVDGMTVKQVACENLQW